MVQKDSFGYWKIEFSFYNPNIFRDWNFLKCWVRNLNLFRNYLNNRFWDYYTKPWFCLNWNKVYLSVHFVLSFLILNGNERRSVEKVWVNNNVSYPRENGNQFLFDSPEPVIFFVNFPDLFSIFRVRNVVYLKRNLCVILKKCSVRNYIIKLVHLGNSWFFNI